MSDPINSFPGYYYVSKFDSEDGNPHNIYRGVDVGFGGYVWAKPGMYTDVVCFDVSGMHPASLRALNLFGDYTKNFADIVDARLAIKHKDFDKAKQMMGGKLAPYLDDPASAKAVSNALKTCVNSVYGLTSAKFDTPMRDPRNVNNIVALRGALFIKTLKDEVEAKGFEVIHCKTDSIKIVKPTPELSEFVLNFATKYGYIFEIEHSFKKICLVNDAVYIAKLAEDDPDDPGKWTATGAQFQIPYVFKTLFSKEPIGFADLCEVKEVKGAIYLDMNEIGYPDVSSYEKELTKLSTAYDKLQPDFLAHKIDPGKLYSEENTIPLFEKEEDRKKAQEMIFRRDELISEIEKGHNFRFVGKVGEFCPIKPGKGGGLLVKTADHKYLKDSVTGAKDYRWLESEVVRENHKENDIDLSYFNSLVDKAIESINKFGDFEWFASDD